MYLDSRRPHDALPILEELWKKWPDQARFAQYLAQCYLALRRRADAKAILEELIRNPPKPAPRKKKGEEAAAEKPAEVAPTAEVAPALEVAKQEITKQDVAAEAPKDAPATPRPWADLLMGIIHFEENDMDAALASLLKAEGADPRLPDLHLRIGEVYLRQRRSDDAERAFLRALEIDGDSPAAHLGLAMVHLRKRRNEEAAEQALQAVGLQHFLPMGHFYLGVALARLGHRERSALAFETALTMLPGLLAAHRWLAAIYQQAGGDPEKAARHREIYLQMRRRREVKAPA
jgi:tetratricopeptide (TPR) repeat protein